MGAVVVSFQTAEFTITVISNGNNRRHLANMLQIYDYSLQNAVHIANSTACTICLLSLIHDLLFLPISTIESGVS